MDNTLTYMYCTRCHSKRFHYVPQDNPFEQRCNACHKNNTVLTDNWIIWKALQKRKKEETILKLVA